MSQPIQYCVSPSGVRLAFSVLGKGSPIVRTSHWMTHIDHDLESPIWRHVVLGLSRRHSLVRYDARGEGLSQRLVDEVSLEAWIEDLETVVDALKLPRFALFGASQGAATAVAYAVRHPERVSHLILYGGFARGMAYWQDLGRRAYELDTALNLIRQGWGGDQEAYRQWFTSMFLPDGTAEQYRWFNHLQQVSATPDMAERHLRASSEIDVRPLLAKVTTPTLVLHARDDAVAPFSLGQELAHGIPGAKFAPLDGADHLFLSGTAAHRQFLESIYDFIGDPPPPKGPLPGEGAVPDQIDRWIRRIEQNWAIKIVLLVGALTGLALSCIELWKMLGR